MSEPLDLEPIKARVQAANAGPWTVRPYEEWQPEWVYVAGPKGYNVGMSHGENVLDEPLRCDAAFIAHARQDVPALIAEVERLRRQLRLIAEAGERQAKSNGGPGWVGASWVYGVATGEFWIPEDYFDEPRSNTFGPHITAQKVPV